MTYKQGLISTRRAAARAPSPALRAALAMFGLCQSDVRSADDQRRPSAARAGHAARRLMLGEHRLLITGPSGSGKSTLMTMIAGRCRALGARVFIADPLRLPGDAHVLDLACERRTGNAQGRDFRWVDALGRLARVGLADATLLGRCARELSDGQRSRLAIARALALAGSPEVVRGAAQAKGLSLIVVDEFTSGLDRATARCVCHALSRLDLGKRCSLVMATSHADVKDWLSVQCIARVDDQHGVRLEHVARAQQRTWAPRVKIEIGTLEDYRALAQWHYRAGAPATCVQVLRARAAGDGQVVGVLVVSMPTLNGRWRDAVWPGVFGPLHDRPGRARAINAGLRTISRVVVSPSHRGVGIARRLVRAYLKTPLTPMTEAIAAMGRVCPFFEAAGMRAIELPPSDRDQRLVDALAFACPWAMDPTLGEALPIDVPLLAQLARESMLMHCEIRRWSLSSRATSALGRNVSTPMLRAACGAINTASAGGSVAYAANVRT